MEVNLMPYLKVIYILDIDFKQTIEVIKNSQTNLVWEFFIYEIPVRTGILHFHQPRFNIDFFFNDIS